MKDEIVLNRLKNIDKYDFFEIEVCDDIYFRVSGRGIFWFENYKKAKKFLDSFYKDLRTTLNELSTHNYSVWLDLQEKIEKIIKSQDLKHKLESKLPEKKDKTKGVKI